MAKFGSPTNRLKPPKGKAFCTSDFSSASCSSLYGIEDRQAIAGPAGDTTGKTKKKERQQQRDLLLSLSLVKKSRLQDSLLL